MNGKRYPYIIIPVFCRRCLEPYPRFFHVPDEEWESVVPPLMRGEVLCLSCYQLIKGAMDEHS